jgi:hypothetical protein
MHKVNINRRISHVYLILASSFLLFFSAFSFAAKTFITQSEVKVYDQIGGQVIETWPSHTLFTSSHQDSVWITVSGHFPEGEWQPLTNHVYLQVSNEIQERVPQTDNAAETIFHVPQETLFSTAKSTAKAYRLLEPATIFNRLGEVLAQWPVGKNFTSAFENEDAIKVTGHFPDGKWAKLAEPVWIIKPVRMQDRTQPKVVSRPDGISRFVVIDKSSFLMTLYETTDTKPKPLITTPVALGYDRCLSADKGGKCYYTPEGEFTIEFKLFDTDGINWCIPKKMEAEFADKIAKGERCWRGIMGNHALHFGNSLFLHGTSNPSSIGSRTTHGCVRLRNSDIEMVYRLLSEGDKVIITSNPESVLTKHDTNSDSQQELQLDVDASL